MLTTKECPHCEENKPIEEFSPRASWCKSCINEREKKKREKEREALGIEKYERKFKPEPPTSKVCNECETEKPIQEFSIGSGICKECRNRKEREHRKSPNYVPPKRTPEYAAWCEMRKRCLHPNHPAYPGYGGRGISIDSRWDSFHNFLEDVGTRPSDNLSLDRIDNDGDYTKDNTKWSTQKEQCRNKRNNRVVEIDGHIATVTEHAEINGVDRNLIYSRLKRGVEGKDLLSPSLSLSKKG